MIEVHCQKNTQGKVRIFMEFLLDMAAVCATVAGALRVAQRCQGGQVPRR
jgi:hypothetical protein